MQEILANMGKNIDVIAGIFDETNLNSDAVMAPQISREPFCGGINSLQAGKKKKLHLMIWLEKIFMLMQRGWSYYGDILRDDMMKIILKSIL